jgi:hypothetical protein
LVRVPAALAHKIDLDVAPSTRSCAKAEHVMAQEGTTPDMIALSQIQKDFREASPPQVRYLSSPM